MASVSLSILIFSLPLPQKLIPETQGTCFRTFLDTATTTAAAAAAAAAATATATATNIIIINYYLIKRGAYM